MAPRDQLQTLLESFTEHVYFQAPGRPQIEYPCIMYNIDDEDVRHAANKPYNRTQRYQVTVIDRDPDTLIRHKVADLPMCIFNRFYRAENLNHYVYILYF